MRWQLVIFDIDGTLLDTSRCHGEGSDHSPYSGVHSLLRTLVKKGIKVAAITHRSESADRVCLEKYFPDIQFSAFVCAPLQNNAFIGILSDLGISPHHSVVVSCFPSSIQISRNCEIESIAVTWGQCSSETLSDATFIADNRMQLRRILLADEVKNPKVKGGIFLSEEMRELLKVAKLIEKREDDLDRRRNILEKDINTQQETLDLEQARLMEIGRTLGEDFSAILNTKADVSTQSEMRKEAEHLDEWEMLLHEAEETLDYQPLVENFLNIKEINYSLEEIKQIDKEFVKVTSLNKTDLAFLGIATALQILRWVIIQQIAGDIGNTIDKSERISSEDGDSQKKSSLKQYVKEKSDKFKTEDSSENDCPSWKDLILGRYPKIVDGVKIGKTRFKCPYDAQKNAPAGFGKVGDHRVNTLGHDPVLGWIFGTANIMTCTITLSQKFGFGTWRVHYPGSEFVHPRIPASLMFTEAVKVVKNDRNCLPAALFAQLAHLKSDINSFAGLQVPLLEVFSSDLAGGLYEKQYDFLCSLSDAAIIGEQVIADLIINMIITIIHRFFYDEAKDGSRELYDVRTRKILMISNGLSSLANGIYSSVAQDWHKLDIGGMLVTISRIATDATYIARLKQSYVEEKLYERLEEQFQFDA